MKKDSLLKMKDLPATEEMLAVAREDVPVKVGSGWNTPIDADTAVLHEVRWRAAF